MTAEPFTPAGVTALQTQLNALSAGDLKTQAGLIRSDFSSWIQTNFTLDADQKTYLAGIDSEFMILATALTAFAVENKLTISLSVTGSPTTFKLIHLANTITCDYSPDGFSTSGALTYAITYE